MNKSAIRYLSLLLVFLMGGSFLAGITTFGQTSSTAGGVTISVSNEWVGNDTVVLVAIYNPNVPQSAQGAKYVAGNVTISAGGVTVPLISNDTSNASVVYYLNNGQHYFWFFITMTPVPTTNASSLSMTETLTINSTSTNVQLTNPYLSFTTPVGNVQTDGKAGVFQLTLPSSFPNQLIGEYGQTVYGGHKVNITDLYFFSGNKTITISYSTGASVTINNYLADSSNYAATRQTTESTVPLNSTWQVYFVDNIMQANPLVGGNGGFMITANGKQVSPVIQNVSYLAVKNGVYVNTTVFANNPVPNAQAMFGYGNVYYGNFTVYTSSIVTNKTYATLLSGNHYYTPANVSFSQYKMLITSGLFTTNTPITIYLSDWIGNNASVSITGTIKETTPQSITLSVQKGENLTVNDFNNISNYSVSRNIMVYVALQSITGSTYKTAMVSLPETYAGSGVFSLPTVLRIGSSPSITYSTSQVTITLPPYDFSNTSLLITATNDIGASYYYLGSNTVKNISTPGTISVGTPTLVPIPNVVSVANVTPVIELAYTEPNLAFGTATTLTVSGTSVKYNGVQVATDSVTAVLPNGTVISGNLNGLSITSLTSANGNGTFFIVVPSTVIKTFLGTHTYIPSGTELTFKIYDEFAAQTLSVTYKFTTVAPVIAIKTPTSTSFSSAETAYLPPLPYNVVPEKHYISVNVTDTLYAQSVPSSALQTTLKIIVENPAGQKVGNVVTTVVSETAANSGLFTGKIYYTVYENSSGYWLNINGQNITNLKNVVNGGLIVFEYTSPSSQSTVNATALLEPSPFTLSVSQTSANPGQHVNVSVNSPGLVESSNMKFTGSLIIYAQFAEWNGTGSQPTIAVSPITLKEVSAGSPVFGGTIVLGNSSVVSSGNLTSLITTPGYTVAPGSVVLVNANATIGPTSTSSSITPYYQQQSISINVVDINVSILNPSPASPFAKLEIELQSPLFNLLTHPAAGNYTSAGTSAGILEGILSTITTQQSQQLVTSTQLVTSPKTSFYYNNTIWVIETPMTLWSGTPGSYGIPIEVNLTDLLTVTHNVYAIHVVEVPNVTTGTVSLVSAYAVPSVSSNVAQLQINGLVPPVISVFFNGNNITQSASAAIPFPNTTAGELVNVTVYAPDAVNNLNVPGSGTTFNVTIVNTANGETTTLTLTQMTKIIGGVAVPTPYYTGLLKVVEPTVYTPGTPGVISASSGVVNKVLVNMNLVEGQYYNTQGLLQQLRMKASSYFYVGVIKLSVLVSHFTILSNGTPVTGMQVGKSYSLLFNVTNNGNVNETIYGTLEVLLNGTPVQPEIVAQITLAPGQSTQIGTLFTPTMPGSYTITFIPFQNNLLSIPYNQGLTEVVTAS
ncbi:MAG: S-layer protein SlaA [Metallosphaera sp.]|uniref:S-layer protein SlaA n=1 Tax=Metallosphaera sp. TaxID=2020860 RepID=UPI00317C5AB6